MGEVVCSVLYNWGEVVYALFADNSAVLLSFNDFCFIRHPPPILFYSLTLDEELEEV